MYADHYENVEKAVIDSNFENTKSLLETKLPEKNYAQLLIVAESVIEKRQKECTNNHFRPFLSGGKIALGVGAVWCKNFAINLLALEIYNQEIARLRGRLYSPNIANVFIALAALGGGIYCAVELIRSFLHQSADLDQLYKNAIAIKSLIISKSENPELLAAELKKS